MISPKDVLKSIFGIDTGFSSILVMNIRLPRVIIAFLIGGSLGLAGAILQGVVKNPLASPEILGISNGGAVGALVFLTIFTNPNNNSLTTSIFYIHLYIFFFSCSYYFLYLWKIYINKKVNYNRCWCFCNI